ncbi:MAG: flagellar biosynthesis protein FlhB [Deltaproteobacteria bacterium]|nr:flagellar biosynthesis protein FlhB [Deltaproteobacteria bacterium]
MADERDNLERSEEATPKRREAARKRGQVARSRALIPTAALLGAVLVLPFAGEELIVRMARLFRGFLSLAGERRELSPQELFALSLESGRLLLPMMAALFAGVVLTGVSGGLAQTGLLWTTEPLRPDFSRLNPLTGLRRLVSLEAVVELGKALLEVVCLSALAFFFLRADIAALASLPTLEVGNLLLYASREGAWLLKAGVAVMAILTGLDYGFQCWRTRTQLRMSRQEIKEEMREQEGDPLLKSRLKSLRQKLARQRMMAEVPKADVVITNPTELAVALRYSLHEMAAPRVVAKGAGFVARRIREIAREHSIPLMENKPLARLLYREVEVGQEIPDTLYRAVAEVLAYVFRLRQGRNGTGDQRVGSGERG